MYSRDIDVFFMLQLHAYEEHYRLHNVCKPKREQVPDGLSRSTQTLVSAYTLVSLVLEAWTCLSLSFCGLGIGKPRVQDINTLYFSLSILHNLNPCMYEPVIRC